MTAGQVGELVQKLLEADGYEVETLVAKPQPDCVGVMAVLWRDGHKFYSQGTVVPADFVYARDIATHPMDTDPFRGL